MLDLTGVIQDRAGTPQANVNVMITGGSPEHHDIAIVTGDDGRFRFSGLQAGVYTVLANSPTGSQQQVVVVLPQTELIVLTV